MLVARIVAPLCLLGCSSSVLVDPPKETCKDGVAPEDVVEVGPITSATLIGDMLHVEGLIDGRESYAVLDVSRQPARLVEMRPDLVGGATWTHSCVASTP